MPSPMPLLAPVMIVVLFDICSYALPCLKPAVQCVEA
jgi:hypothetical protein